MHSTHQPSPSQSVLVRSSLCIPPTGNPPLQSVRVCPASASATTVHCVFHLPQSELVLSISLPVNENHFCSPHNCQSDRNQCLWFPWCAFHYVLPFCSFCLLAITPMQSMPLHLPTITDLCFLFAPVNRNHCAFHPSASISHHHRNQCLCVPVCAFHPPAIHRCNQCVCVQHPRQQPQFTVRSTCHNQNLCLVLSISIPVNENHLCSPHNCQPDHNQCLWVPWCAFHYVLPFCSFCLLAITPMQSVPVCSTGARNCSAYPSIILSSFFLNYQLIHIIHIFY